MTADRSARRTAAAVLLAAAAAEAFWTARHLGTLHGRPDRALPYFCLFGAAFSLAFLAGRLSRADGSEPPAGPGDRGLSPGAGIASLLLLGATLVWQSRSHPSLWILAVWAAALVACAAAFPAAKGAAAAPPEGSSRGRALALAAVLAAAAYARLTGLDAVPPYFGGDEANHTLDGVGLICGEGRSGPCGRWWDHVPTDPYRTRWYGARSDPFGTGYFSAMRLAMLPAGGGALALRDRIRGPRFPYALAGALSVAACAGAAALVAGWWGALGCAALLAFLPHHVHFSRLASFMILDALSAALVLLLLLAAHRSLSPRTAAAAGIAGGLALYGYFGGRAIALAFVLAAPLLLASRRARGRRGLLALALAAGFWVAAAPALRFIASEPRLANGRILEVGISNPAWWSRRVAELGSPARVLADQFLGGTVGLLSQESSVPWFTGHPMLGSGVVPALALAGYGWLLGRRQLFAVFLLGLLAAANLAVLILSESTPAPQRMSFLPAVLTIAGGAAIAGFLSLLPAAVRAAAAAVAVGGILAWTFGGPPDVWEPSPGYSGATGGFLRSAYGALSGPRFAGETVFLHGRPYMDRTMPLFGYFLPQIRWVDVEPPKEGEAAEALRPGLHVFAPDWLESGLAWRARCPAARGFALGDPADPRTDVALVLRVPDASSCEAE